MSQKRAKFEFWSCTTKSRSWSIFTEKKHTSMVIKGSLGHFCSSGRQMQEIALAGWTSTNVLEILFLFFWSFCFPSFLFINFFFQTYFHFLTDLNYTGWLIASSLSAFISKKINPLVSHRHPLICLGSSILSC